jgi:hypothetical protein
MPGHLKVCGACEARLIRDLAAIPELAAELDITLTRQAKTGGGGGQADVDEPGVGLAVRRAPLPWIEAAADARDVLKSALVGWWRELAGDALGPICAACEHPSCEWVHLGRVPDDTLAGIARWLGRHTARLVGHAAAEEAVDEITTAVAKARHAVDRAADRIYAGPCDECGRDLYAKPDAITVACSCIDDNGQRTRYEVTERRNRMLSQVEDQLAHSVAMSSLLGLLGVRVPAPTIRYFAQKGRITEKGRDKNNRPLYRLGDVRKVANERKKEAG